MKRRLPRGLVTAALCLGLLAGTAHASDLKLDGRVNVKKLMGDSVQISVTGGAGFPVWMFLDISPGPTVVLGKTLPIGFTPFMISFPLGVTNGAGNLTVSLPIPSNPGSANFTIYAMAVIVDPGAPAGLDESNGASLTFLDRNIDMAGNSLGSYPFFEHVAAINGGSSVELGIDPTRYPFIVGQTADVYIVESKTRTQWIGDPSLTDVRGGGAQTVSFSGTTIQQNTFTIDAGTITGQTGTTDIGVPYDVIIDFDQDGVFDDDSDLIDGYSDTEAGFYVVKNLAAPGPLAVTEILYNLGGLFRRQNTYYPTNIGSMGKLPLVVISHGNGHEYTWYDHLGYHLASYGYVVMSHQNDTEPGSHTAAITTRENTEAFLGALGSIQGGVLQNHVDENNIAWFGHSRGGDGVVRAYRALATGAYVPTNYSTASIKLVSSIAPVDFGGSVPPIGEPASIPGFVNYHLWVGAADEDVNNCAISTAGQPFKLHDRAQGARASISLYGVGHADFHTSATYPFVQGPCQLGKAKTHTIMRGYVIPLVKHFMEGNIPAKDYLWRQYDTFRTSGVPFEACTVANLMFQEHPTNRGIIDDFQTNSSPILASSGAAVSFNVPDYSEDNLDDRNAVFTHIINDPFNGFLMDASRSGGVYADDNSVGSVFSVDNNNYFMTYSLLPQHQDLSNFEYLQFRAAQATRHPLTTAQLADFTFSVTLRDGAGMTSSINFGAYGGGIEEPYQREIQLQCSPTGLCCDPPFCVVNQTLFCGTGVGWNNEFETIRIRLGDFLNNGRTLDMTNITRVIFNFGPAWGSANGRIGLDEIEVARR